jgi:microcin C transport system permease protein
VLFGLTLDHPVPRSSVVSPAACRAISAAGFDLLFQRFIEIWSSIPYLYLLLILSSVLVPGFFVLARHLAAVLLGVAGWPVRARFLRGRNFEYIQAARALGVSNAVIMFRHLLPNAMVADHDVPALHRLVLGDDLTALDFLGFGLPPGSPVARRIAVAGQGQRAGAMARLHRLLCGGHHAVAADLHRRGRARRFDPRKTFQKG